MVGERIKKLIELLNTDARHFAENLGVEPSSISHLINGRNKPSFAFLQKLVKRFPDVNINWILSGEGEPLNISENNYVKQGLFNFDNEENKRNQRTDENVKTGNRDVEIVEKNKKVEKIILIYTDGTFKIYENENI